MKNLKKVLAVVLAVALAFSLASVAFAANSDITSYSDKDKITQKEAVNVLTYAGVLSGSNGAFDPTGTFTRESAAKVIAYLMLGPSIASTLPATASSFKDVATTRWSAPFIAYCASKGVIGGDGSGNFNPTASVTGSQFAKMLLTALGYGKVGEYTGINWEINAISDASALKILTLNVNYSSAATREQVAQYALNSLYLTFQNYSTVDLQYHNSTAAINTFQGRLLLVKNLNQNIGGVIGHTWQYNSLPFFAFYPDESVIATSTNGIGIATLVNSTSPYFKAALASSYDVYVNGTPATKLTTITAGTTVLTLGNYAFDTTANALFVGNASNLASPVTLAVGDSVSFVDLTPTNGLTQADKVSIIIQKVDTLAAAVTVTAGINGNPDSVSVPLTSGGTLSLTSKTASGYTGLAKGDVVTYYKDFTANVTNFTKCTKATGTLSAFNSTYGTVTVGGTVYTLNTAPSAKALGAYTALVGSIDVYTDANGYAVWVAGTPAAATANMAVMLAHGIAAASGVTAGSVQAKLLMPDATTKVVTIATVDSQAATLTAANNALNAFTGPIVTYTIDAYGNYSLSDATTSTHASVSIASGVASFDSANPSVYANSSTIFLIANTNGTYSVFTGISAVPSSSGSTYYYNATTGACNLVYISVPGTISASPNTVFFFNTAYTQTLATATTPKYDTFSAVVGSTATAASDVKVLDTVIGNGAHQLDTTKAGLYSVTYDANGYVNSADLVSGGGGSTLKAGTVGTVAAYSNVVGLSVGTSTNYYSYVATAPVYYYDTVARNLTVKGIDGIATDVNDKVAFALNSTTNQVTAVYIISSGPFTAATAPTITTVDHISGVAVLTSVVNDVATYTVTFNASAASTAQRTITLDAGGVWGTAAAGVTRTSDTVLTVGNNTTVPANYTITYTVNLTANSTPAPGITIA